MSELLPCPFCGKPAIESWSRDNEVVNIRCSDWRSNVCLGAGPNSYDLDEAIKAWNRRAQPAPGAEPVTAATVFALHPFPGEGATPERMAEQVNSALGQLARGESEEVHFGPKPTDSAALRDAERLDWLEHMAGDPGGLLLHDGSVKPPRLGLGLRPGSTRRTLREAIDAAMAQHGGQQND